MDEEYSPVKIEKKWQKRWESMRLFEAEPDPDRPKFYCLEMLPYPSGFLHMGHVRNYSIGDAFSWYKRLCGFNVIHPIGWDSFGQPAEQAAIKHGIQPREWTEKNIEHMRGQLKRLGISYDWGISRQRFWGAPIPVIYCDRCSIVPVPESDLPVLLPEKAEFTGTGQSPLVGVEEFVNTTCPRCGAAARRETDTMDTFVDSSWYFFRYCDPENGAAPFDVEAVGYWSPVDLYIGGIDNAVMHLLYTRFWTKMMRDIGLVSFNEPVTRLLTQGMVTNIVEQTGEWKAMSKSLGNGVDPDRIIAVQGVDAVRLFVLFASPPEHELRWSEAGIEGMARFLRRVRKLVRRWSEDPKSSMPHPGGSTTEVQMLRREIHRAITRVTEDIENLRLNTAIAALMELTNALLNFRGQSDIFDMREALEPLILMLAPFAPHFAEEMWEQLGYSNSILSGEAKWPQSVDEFTREEALEIPVQINGKLRAALKVSAGASQDEIRTAAMSTERVRKLIEGREIIKIIFIPQRMINIVVR
jgi:leucyl-tRNA synthetase